MASQERLHKSLEALKILSQNQPYDQAKKREKIHLCYVVTETFTNPTIKVSANYSDLLSVAVGIMLKLCDDSDADVRMTSDECLNRIIQAVDDSHIGKIQIELHKEIKKNGAPRSLRAALIRFSQLAHHIRPYKGKPYVVNLFPSIISIADRAEETIHETLSSSLPRILKVLGIFASDSDIKALLKSFLQNVPKTSAAIRRTSSNCILTICLASRRSSFFVTYCINHLLDIVVPVDNNQSSCSILGVLYCLKLLLPSVKNIEISNEGSTYLKDLEVAQPIAINRLLQVYELCIYYLASSDHNIVNASLDTLNVFLVNATNEVKEILLSPNGIDRCRIQKSQSYTEFRSSSQLSMATNATSDNLFSECELTETIETDIERWIGESKLSVINMPHMRHSDTTDFSAASEKQSESNPVVEYYENPVRHYESFGVDTNSASVNDTFDKLSVGSPTESVVGSDEKILDNKEDVDIGSYLDKSVPLLFCTRLIAKSFLLSGIPNKYISDTTVRVSVKSSAVTCLSSIFRLYPYSFYSYLDRNYTSSSTERVSKVSSQKIADIMLLRNHSDPQLRGVTRCVTSDLVVAVLEKTNLDLHLWPTYLQDHANATGMKTDIKSCFGIEFFVDVWIQGLQDENSNCLRQMLVCLKPTLALFVESSNCNYIIPILNALPMLANNPYWLVKVSLCELLSSISYVTIYHITGNSMFQEKVMYNILFEFLNDTDQRIRTAASIAIIDIIDKLYFDDYHPKESVITTKGLRLIHNHSFIVNNEKTNKNLRWTQLAGDTSFPQSQNSAGNCDRLNYILSKIIMKLYIILLETRSKCCVFGCIEALSMLSSKYPCTVYRLAWGMTDVQKSNIPPSDLLGLCVSLLLTSIHIYDIPFFINLMNFTSNIYAGCSLMAVKGIDVTENISEVWPMFTNDTLKSLSDQYLSHVMKLLNIFTHVISDIVPAAVQNKAVLPQLPTSGTLSPIKRRKSEDKKLFLGTTRFSTDKDEKTEKKEAKFVGLGYFAGSQHYMRIFEMLRNAFANYKVSLDPTTSEKFLELMRKTLHAICILMEVGTLFEFGRISEEILGYLKTTFRLDRTLTVQCVQKLLKCLFGTNFTASYTDLVDDVTQEEELDKNYSFYHSIFEKSCDSTSSYIHTLNTTTSKIECDGDSTVMGYLHRKDFKITPVISRATDKTLVNYIRIFEPLVINSLKQYTITSDVIFQCNVLKLLSQLVQLRVNYCLLDSEQVFKDFVLKQFEHIEEGLVPHSEELISSIFQFLVHLSHSKQHSKSIIDIPKIIQLCDGLMASGQDPRTHCIPALESIVEDVFLVRSRSNATDLKELETTREVVLAMLLRLLEYKEVIKLVTLVLEDSKYCKDDTEKWLRWSEQVVNLLLQTLRQDKLRISDHETFVCLKTFISTLNPNVFRPADNVIILIFQDPPLLQNGQTLSKWLSKLLILFYIISPLKEDELIEKINLLNGKFSPGSIYESYTATADPLNVQSNAEAFQKISGEAIVARLIFRIISIISSEISANGSSCNVFLINQFSTFLIYCSYMLQSGIIPKISKLMVSLIAPTLTIFSDIKINVINQNFLSVSKTHPTITSHWCHFLTLLNYNNMEFWNKIIDSSGDSINDCFVKTGGFIVYCNYLHENATESNHISWIVSQHSEKIISLIDEIPVSRLVSLVHQNATLSELFIASINQQCLTNVDELFKLRILTCIENCHTSQTGATIRLLISKLLCNRQIAISRMVANLASRKIEFLLTLPSTEIVEQLSKEDLLIIKNELSVKNLSKKHETVIGLFNKLVRYYDLSPLECIQIRLVNPSHIRNLDINKKWFISQIQCKYKDGMSRKETAKIMEKLEYNELVNFMSSVDFNKIILRDCIQRGVKLLDREEKEESPLLKAAVFSVLKEVDRIVNELCAGLEVISLDVITKLRPNKLFDLFQDESFATLLQNICLAVTALMKHFFHLPTILLSQVDFQNLSKFAVISLAFIDIILTIDSNNFNLNHLVVLLDCADEILNQSQICSYLGLEVNIFWMCSSINSLFLLVEYLLKDESNLLPSVQRNLMYCSSENIGFNHAREGCYQLYTLTRWLYNIQNNHVKIPMFLLYRIRNLIVSLARLPVVNSFNFVPSRVWKLGWEPELKGKFLTQVPPLPISMLQDIDVLQEYIFRINLLGWTSRQQFEESWMCFLSVLCTPLDNLDPVDITFTRRTSCFAIKAITAQLLQTLRYPVLGNKNVSSIIHVSRNTAIPNTTVSTKKLKIIQDHIESEALCNSRKQDVRNVFTIKNFEKSSEHYSYGQISIRYFLVAAKAIEKNENAHAEIMYEKRSRLLNECGLDINSCLQFLLDYYSQVMKSEAAVNDIRILHETVRSTLYISDLFTDKNQFSWMLDMFFHLSKIHSVEDELLHQYLIVGICKAVGVLAPDLEVYEQTKKLLVQFLKSPFLPTRISCLYGLLYIIEGCLLNDVVINGISEELQLILPLAVEYVQSHLNINNPILNRSQEHFSLVWALAFYLIESVDEMHMESNFVLSTLHLAINGVRLKSTNYIDKCVIKGLERLLLMRPMYMLEKVGKNLQKLALEKMKDENPSISLLGVQLLVTYMYVDCWEHLEKPDSESELSSPDHLVQTIEKIAALFELIKKSYVNEVEILCSLLPLLLRDFFSPSDILTKVIGEFLSSQQPHPKLMSGVVFEVFDSAIQLNQLSLLQDWVVFSLTNFTQSFSNMATWCLTCFFISASPNQWLRSFFPYVQNRVGRYEYEDKKIFCIAGSDFYKNLTSDNQRKKFVDNFMKVKDQADMPFSDLLNSL